MDIGTLISLSGNFIELVGQVVADLKRQDIAEIDVELLRLKQDKLKESLENYKRDLAAATQKEMATKTQNLITRGLNNSTVSDSTLRCIEQDARTELDRAMREYNRAIEEIALMEKRVKVKSRSPWRRLLPWRRG